MHTDDSGGNDERDGEGRHEESARQKDKSFEEWLFRRRRETRIELERKQRSDDHRIYDIAEGQMTAFNEAAKMFIKHKYGEGGGDGP